MKVSPAQKSLGLDFCVGKGHRNFFPKRPRDSIAPEPDAETAAGGLEYRSTANGSHRARGRVCTYFYSVHNVDSRLERLLIQMWLGKAINKGVLETGNGPHLLIARMARLCAVYEPINTYPAPALWFCLLGEIQVYISDLFVNLFERRTRGVGEALARQGVARWQAIKSASAYMLCWHANTLYIHAFVATMSPICSFRRQQTANANTKHIFLDTSF